jgi:hypothetical protein
MRVTWSAAVSRARIRSLARLAGAAALYVLRRWLLGPAGASRHGGRAAGCGRTFARDLQRSLAPLV